MVLRIRHQMSGIVILNNLFCLFLFLICQIWAQNPENSSQEVGCFINDIPKSIDFWTWARQQSEFDTNDCEVQEFLEGIEGEEQTLFPPPVIHPIMEKYNSKLEEAYNNKLGAKNEFFGKFFKRVLSIKNIAKNKMIDEKSKMPNDNSVQNINEKENLNNLLKLIHYDSTLLKGAILGNNQCINKVSILFSGIKYRLNSAVDMVANRYGIGQIVPTKIEFKSGKILKKLAAKWIKVKKSKNENGKGKKSEYRNKYIADMLSYMKSLLAHEQFEVHSTGQKRLRRRRKRIPGLIIAVIVLLIIITPILAGLIYSECCGAAEGKKEGSKKEGGSKPADGGSKPAPK